MTVEPLRLGHPTWKRKRGDKLRKTKKEREKEQVIEFGSQSFLWELLEMEAPQKFYIDDKEKPAFLLFPRWHWASTKTGYSLYLNTVGLIARFTSQKKALTRLKQIVENANFPLRLYQVSKFGRKRGKRVLFAQNDIQRVDMTDAKGAMKVFNIEEWQQEA